MYRTVLVALLSASAFYAQSAAGIQGTVTDAVTKKPISGAFVTALRTGLPPASQTASSAADGSFQVSGLPAGTYSLCVQVPGGAYVDPCQWSSPSQVTLSAGQSYTGSSLTLSPGYPLQVYVADPNQLLSQKTADGRNPELIAGVWTSGGMFRPMYITTKASTGVTFSLTIPAATALNLRVASRDVNLNNSGGAAIAAAGDQQSFQYTSGGSAIPAFSYTVVSAKP
jgi:hypothetical protein